MGASLTLFLALVVSSAPAANAPVTRAPAGRLQLTAVRVGGAVAVTLGASAGFVLGRAEAPHEVRLALDLARALEPAGCPLPAPSPWAMAALLFALAAPAGVQQLRAVRRAVATIPAPPPVWHPG